MIFTRYWQAQGERQRDKTFRKEWKALVPMNVTDPRYSGDLLRKQKFNRWYKRPERAHKLYWRLKCR